MKQMRNALFWVITQPVMVLSYERYGITYYSHRQRSRIGFLVLEDVNRLCQNISKTLPLPAA